MKSLRSERLTILLHILGWAILFLFPFIGRETYSFRFVFKSIFHIVVLASFFYANLFVFTPKFLFSKKVGLYVLTTLLGMAFVVSSFVLFDAYWDNKPRIGNNVSMQHGQHAEHLHGRLGLSRPGSVKFIFPLISFLMVFGLSTSLRTISEYLEKEKLQKRDGDRKVEFRIGLFKVADQSSFFI